jgi:hypothetical protein
MEQDEKSSVMNADFAYRAPDPQALLKRAKLCGRFYCDGAEPPINCPVAAADVFFLALSAILTWLPTPYVKVA